MSNEFDYNDYPQKEGDFQPGPWGPMGDPRFPERLWLPTQGSMEAAPGLTIGTVHHTEPICRVSGYLQPVVENAHLIAAAPEMYAALILVDDYFSNEREPLSKECVTVRAALAKAQGENDVQ